VSGPKQPVYRGPADQPAPAPGSRVVVATDGSIQSAGDGTAWLAADGRWGLRVRRRHGDWRLDPLAVELRAIAEAVDWHVRHPLLVLTDSQPAAAMVQGWTTGAGISASLAEAGPTVSLLARQASRLGRSLEVQWVRGHDMHPLNEGADSLAKLAACAVRDRITNPQLRHRADGIAATFARAYRAEAS
jgi:ribonuclease HI